MTRDETSISTSSTTPTCTSCPSARLDSDSNNARIWLQQDHLLWRTTTRETPQNDSSRPTKLHAPRPRNSPQIPPKPTNYCVGAVIVDESSNKLLATGYTLELPGNTHAEQCALLKLAQQHNIREEELGSVLPESTVLYTTMEPCVERLSGNLPCLQRILRLKRGDGRLAVGKVYTGVQEPSTFVKENESMRVLREAGVEYVKVDGFEEEILAVATAGHVKKEG